MRNKYRTFLRGSVYWIQDTATRKQESLRTNDRTEAKRLLHAKNEACRQPIINMQIARAYLFVGDPESAERKWYSVMEDIVKLNRSVQMSNGCPVHVEDVVVFDRAGAFLRAFILDGHSAELWKQGAGR